jgi:hypothetical protein
LVSTGELWFPSVAAILSKVGTAHDFALIPQWDFVGSAHLTMGYFLLFLTIREVELEGRKLPNS